ncbi:tail fiber domain-containing protein [uncultured Limosilactobacillus sp.]|uniref:tail fiber domain-containing protein n=1 Tax=uncultured Limosilactobacillus sp. TaxID=2837629 RepID=UPI002596114F|nr:tail fiber domain-containing protein [uncultured Limosilactobacillus sp.]
MLYKQIVLEWGRDTETGVWGKGYSPDNGEHFYVTDTTFGRKYRQNDADGLWNNGMHEKVKEKVNQEIANTVEPAIKQADSAVAYANDAIEKSRVNSQAIVEINSAVSDAISDAAVARSDGLRAWDAAQSNVGLIDSNYASASAAISSARTEAIAAADEAKASASAAQADIVAVRSDVAAVQADVTATRSDVATAKSDIADTKTNLTSQAKSLSSYAAQASAAYNSTASALSDAKTELSSDVAVAKNLANTAQATADSAVESASSVANNLAAVASQANANANGITKVTSDVGLLQNTVADNTGDISTIQETAKQIQQAVSDNSGNITVAKQTADSAVAVASDARSNATVAIQTASQASITANNASGQAASAVLTANGAMTTASNAKSDATVAVQTASGASLTATNAKSDATVAKQTASEAKVQASNAESDFAQLSIRAEQIEASVANNSGAIANVQQTANGLTTTVADIKGDVSQLKVSASSASVALSDAAGNISSLQATAKSYSAALSDAKGDIATVKATASELETKYADAAGNINKLQTDAKGTTQTLADAKGDIAKLKTRADGFDTEFASTNGDISKLQTDASGAKQTLTNAKSDIAVLQSRADGFDTKFADTAGDINKLQVDASGMKQTLTDAQGNISTLQATATGFKNTLTDAQGNISTLQSDVSGLKKTTSDHAGNIATLQANAKTLTSQMSSAQGDISTLKQTASGFSSKVSGMETSLANANSKINDITSNGGGRNLLRYSTNDNGKFQPNRSRIDNYIIYAASTVYMTQGQQYTVHANASDGLVWSGTHNANVTSNNVVLWLVDNKNVNQIISDANTGTRTTFTWNHPSGTYYLRVNTYKSDNSGYVEKVMLEKGAIAHDWSPAPEDTDAKITTNSAAIDQNKKAITLKADQTTVDKTNETVQQLQSQLKVQADQIATKVSSSDLDAKGYATQTYTQTQIKQTADSWNANLASVKNGLTDKYTNLHATVDGIKGTVATKADQSEVTQLSNLVQAKVSSGDFTSTTTQLKNLINQRVQVGDVISQINQEAGGNTLIQVSNGKGSLILDAGNTIVTGKAWIPSAAIANLTADDIKTGTLTGSTVHLDDGNGNTIDLGALSTDYVGFHSKATNGDQTYIDLNGIHNYGSSYDTKISQGKITTNFLAVNGGGLIDFRSSGNGMTIDSQNIKFYNSNAVNGGIEFSGGSPLATVRDGTVGNELRVRYDRSFALTPITDESARICASSAAMQVGFIQSGSSTPDRQTTGLWVDNDRRHVNLGVWGADSTWARVEANTHNIHMQADKAHAWLSSDNVFHIYKDGDSSSTATQLRVDGWAWVSGWVEAAGHSQHSALSTKTDIQPVDDDKMLEMVNDTDLATFLYKTDVANGETHRHIGLIIDDVHDVAQYQTPQEFIAPNGVSRDDDNMIGALFGAVKALTKRIKTLENKVG